MKTSATIAASSSTSPIDQTLASMISAGVTGITSRCSMVPCSRSRISAAPVRMIDSSLRLSQEGLHLRSDADAVAGKPAAHAASGWVRLGG